MNYLAAEQRCIRCHAGHDPASSLDFWFPAPALDYDPGFAEMTPKGNSWLFTSSSKLDKVGMHLNPVRGRYLFEHKGFLTFYVFFIKIYQKIH